MPSPKTVADRFMEASGSIQLHETDTTVEVSGPYNEMLKINPKLKSRGFWWDPAKRVWSIPRSKLTPAQINNVRKLIQGPGAGPAPKPGAGKDSPAKLTEAELEAVNKAFEAALQDKVFGYQWKKHTHGVLLITPTPGADEEAKRAGGRRQPDMWEFQAPLTKLDGFEDLRREVLKQSEVMRDRTTSVAALLRQPRSWPHLGVSASYSNYRVHFSGKTYDVKGLLTLPEIKWENGAWIARAILTTANDVERVFDKLDKEEAQRKGVADAARAKAEAERAQMTPDELNRAWRKKLPANRKAGPCKSCRGFVPVGQGGIYQDHDTDDWLVIHRDPAVCEEIRATARIQAEAARNRSQAIRSIQDLIQKSGDFPAPWAKPQGQEIVLDGQRAYGGGSWLVLEPDESHVWYVQNNGMDGDNWSRNNVETGGAGALGWRAPYTDEMRAILTGLKLL